MKLEIFARFHVEQIGMALVIWLDNIMDNILKVVIVEFQVYPPPPPEYEAYVEGWGYYFLLYRC